MELRIQKLRIQNFKGIKNKEISFDGKSSKIIGENGSGKSTCADAFYFLFGNCNYALVNNPMITPLGMSECTSEVEAEIEINGKPCKVKKAQKYKEKTDDSGKTTSSVTNTYSINDVEKSQKDFVADMVERGLDMDRFMIFSNPNSFMSDMSKQGREKMRATLFKMADGYTDEEIIKSMPGLEELSALIENYKIDEIEQMQKSTLRKILEICGKDNSVINAKIDGMLSSKAVIDIKALEGEKAAIQANIDTIQAQLDSECLGRSEIEKKITSLKADKAKIIDKINSDIKKKESELQLDLIHLETEKSVISSENFLAVKEVNDAEKEINSLEESLENWRDLYKKVQAETLNEKDFICPTCGQALPDEEIADTKANFESSKNERMNSYKARGEEAKHKIESLKINKEESENRASEFYKKIVDLDIYMDEIRKQIDGLPKEINSNEETDKIDAEIALLVEELAKDNTEKTHQLNAELVSAKEKLREIIGNIAIGERNSEIDAKVEALREERKKAEINRAKAEKILDEVDKFKRQKNSLLTETINKHFNIVSFKLFDYLKNGNYQECVELLIDGKPISSCANGSLIQLAKLDCLSGLSNYFDEHYPVFLDDAALVTSNTSNRINITSQLIQLVATEGIKEIEIKGE